MRVLVIGGTGYIGSAVRERLAERGHLLVLLVRNGELVASMPGDRDTDEESPVVRAGDLLVPGSLADAALDVDAVIYLATPLGSVEADLAAVRALLVQLRGTSRPFVYTSGCWVLGATGGMTAAEDARTNPISIVADRPAVESEVLAAQADGVAPVVVRPAIAHGRGGGIPRLLVDRAGNHGIGQYVGDPSVHWPMVHVDDLADLFVLVAENGAPGEILHGVAESAVSTVALAAAAHRAAGGAGRAEPWPEPEQDLGESFAEALGLDQAMSGMHTRKLLGWTPTRRTAIRELLQGSYLRTNVEHPNEPGGSTLA